VVTIIIRKIVHDVLRLLSSCKGPGSLLHLPSCHNRFLLSNKPNWSFMNNLLPLHHLMSLCVLVTPRRTKLQSQLEPKIILHQRRKLTIYQLHWFDILSQLHLQTILFISNDWAWIQLFVLLPRALFESLHLILMHMLPKTTIL
jgi:hypothetical protein